MANEICIYGDIGQVWWAEDGITDIMVVNSLKELDQTSDRHVVRINSLGGRADMGLAIMNVLRSHKDQMKVLNPAFQLETVVDGYAMSAASVIMMAGDVRTIALGGVVMIHDAWTGCYGNAEEMIKSANWLNQLSANISNIYSALCVPAGKDQPARDAAFFREKMQAETYFIGDEAISCGLATQQDTGLTASLSKDLTPENMKGRYVSLMTAGYQRRTFNRATAAKSIADTKSAIARMNSMLATITP